MINISTIKILKQTSQPVKVAHREILITRREPLTPAHAHDTAYDATKYTARRTTAHAAQVLHKSVLLPKAYTRDYYCQRQCCLLKI